MSSIDQYDYECVDPEIIEENIRKLFGKWF